MEHAQRDMDTFNTDLNKSQVLILILMEHAQRERNENRHSVACWYVLILILMEHAQRVIANVTTSLP